MSDTQNQTSPTMNRRRIIGSGALALAAIGVSVGFTNRERLVDDDGRLGVTCTVGMITDVARNIGGDAADVTGLMGPGIDPHLYKPSAGDIVRLGDAELILYGGLHLEGRMTETFDRIDDKPTVAVSEAIPEDQRIVVGDGPSWDPHVWFDVTLWRIAAERMLEAMSDAAPSHAETFAANAEPYLERMGRLDKWVVEQVERVPEEQRVLITAHDAFGYFGKRYGFEVRGLQGLSTVSEAGTRDVQQLVDFIVERQIRAMFIESSVPPSAIEAVQAACEARGWTVDIGGELFADAMGEAGTREGTYFGMVTHNVSTIVDALLGEQDPLARTQEFV